MIISLFFVQLMNLLNYLSDKVITYHVPVVDGYKEKRRIRKQIDHTRAYVGVFEKNGEEYIIKSYQYLFKNTRYKQILNEANALKLYAILIKTNSLNTFHVPPVIRVINTKHRITLITKFVENNDLRNSSEEEINKKISNFLKDIKKTKTFSTNRFHLPDYSIRKIKSVFPFYLSLALLRNWRNYKNIFLLFRVYLALFFKVVSDKKILVHRDLSFDNFLISNGKLLLIDAEFACYSEVELEIANLLLNIRKEPKSKLLVCTLLSHLSEYPESKARFIFFTTYLLLETYASLPETHDDITETNTYLATTFKSLLDSLYNKQHSVSIASL